MLGSRTLFRCPESLCKQMKRITITLTALCALTLFIGPVASESTLDSTISSSQWITRGLEEISTKRMMADIRELSGPAFNGRQIGTDNDQQSATFGPTDSAHFASIDQSPLLRQTRPTLCLCENGNRLCRSSPR